MRIGEFAERTGISGKTLRYYEELGLLKPGRTSSGWRNYDDADLLTIQLTGIGKRLGLELTEIVRFVGLFRDPSVGNDVLRRELAPHRSRLEKELAALTQARDLLGSLVEDCPLRRC